MVQARPGSNGLTLPISSCPSSSFLPRALRVVFLQESTRGARGCENAAPCAVSLRPPVRIRHHRHPLRRSWASWEVLQMLGATGLFGFFFLFLPPAGAFRGGTPPGGRGGAPPPRPGSAHDALVRLGSRRPLGNIQPRVFVIVASALGELLQTATRAVGSR